MIDLDRGTFHSWLSSKSPRSLVGDRCSGYSCPISKFVRMQVPGVEVWAGMGEIVVNHLIKHTTPNWMSTFMQNVDRSIKNGRQVTAGYCLKVLEAIP